MFQNQYGEHDAELVRIAIAHAKGLIGHYGYTANDADDLLQTLILAGLLALPRFDATRSKRSTYLYAALRDKVRDLARHAERKKRHRHLEAFSLDADFHDDDLGQATWSDFVGAEDRLHALRFDIEETLQALPAKLRELCRLHALLDSEDARRAAGMAYSTHHRAIKRIRSAFERRGFKKSKSGRKRRSASENQGDPL